MFGAIHWMGPATSRSRREESAARSQQAIQMAYREALGSLRTAQKQLERLDGRWGKDLNPILAAEISAAIQVLWLVAPYEFESDAMKSIGLKQDKYAVALQCLRLAETALVRGGRVSITGSVERQALLHVRTAKWWIEPKNDSRNSYCWRDKTNGR